MEKDDKSGKKRQRKLKGDKNWATKTGGDKKTNQNGGKSKNETNREGG